MVAKSKPWDWKMVKGDYEDKWKTPSQEVYYLIMDAKFSVFKTVCPNIISAIII